MPGRVAKHVLSVMDVRHPVVRLATSTPLLEVYCIATLQDRTPDNRLATHAPFFLSVFPHTVLHRNNGIILFEWPLLFVECCVGINDSNQLLIMIAGRKE